MLSLQLEYSWRDSRAGSSSNMPAAVLAARASSLLPPVPCKPLVRVVKAACAAVELGFRRADYPPQFLRRLGDETRLAVLLAERRIGEQPSDHAAPFGDAVHQLLKVLSRAVKGAEVRQEQRVGVPRKNPRFAFAPLLEIDVW